MYGGYSFVKIAIRMVGAELRVERFDAGPEVRGRSHPMETNATGQNPRPILPRNGKY